MHAYAKGAESDDSAPFASDDTPDSLCQVNYLKVQLTLSGPSRIVTMHGPTGILHALAANGIAMIIEARMTLLVRRIIVSPL